MLARIPKFFGLEHIQKQLDSQNSRMRILPVSNLYLNKILSRYFKVVPLITSY